MTIKEKIGEGSFCKVRMVVLAVNSEEVDKQTGEKTLVPVKQELAVKQFDRKNLKS